MKQKIKTKIFNKSSYNPITWKDLKHIQFQDDDRIEVEYVEPISITDNEHDGYFYVEISRMIEENDDKYEQLLIEMKKAKEMLRQNRLERYLELKKEFNIDNK